LLSRYWHFTLTQGNAFIDVYQLLFADHNGRALSKAGDVGSNLIRGMDFCVCDFLCVGSGLATG
jgi:hypothetical protein